MANILVVDDDPDLRGLVEFRLRKEGHRVLAAGDGPTALEAVAQRGKPDLAVLDVAMPNMTGLELLVALRELPGMEDVPAIFLSARILPSDIAAGRALGASYLTKPFVAPALLASVRGVLGPPDSWEKPIAPVPVPAGAVAVAAAAPSPASLRDADARRAATSKAPPVT